MSGLKPFIPSVPEIAREAIVVIVGAAIAALVIGQLPALKRWIKEQWS